MASIVFFHAHPDDESIATGGSIARAAAEGHQVGVVTATGGEYGEVPEGVEGPEALRELREDELRAALTILGATWGELLGYTDSGMVDSGTNQAEGSFWSAPVDEAAERLARLLRDHEADVLVTYDDHGTYGHPDHIQVHRVGVRAAELAGTSAVFESTADRDYIASLGPRFTEAGFGDTGAEFSLSTFGSPATDITTRVDVRPYLDQKRRAMQAHRSQIAETSFFVGLPDELFELTWGEEWFIRRGAPAGTSESWFF